MAQVLNRSDFSVGQDVQVTIRNNFGDSFSAEDLGILEDVNLKIQRSKVKVGAITHGGKTLSKSIPKEYTCNMTFVRYNSKLAKMQLDADQRYRKTRQHTYYTVSIMIHNPDGSISTYLCKDGAAGDDTLIDAKQDKAIGQSFSCEFPEVVES